VEEESNRTFLLIGIIVGYIVLAPLCIKTIVDNHSDVEIFCATVDRELNNNAYILQVLGMLETEYMYKIMKLNFTNLSFFMI
jgi:uracil phosphoribosyltransferase